MPDLSFVPTGIWGEEYRDAGGAVVPDVLQQMREQQAAREEQYRAATAAAEADAQAGAQRAQQADYDQQQQNFIDWPTFQKITEGTEPGRQYDGYLGALEQQLQAMGYSPEEAQAESQQFQRMVPRPAEDHGFFGNLWESAKSGFESGTRATEAFNAAGDPETLARLLVEQATGGSNPSPLDQYQRATQPGAGEDDTDYWAAIKRRGAAALDHPQGLLDFFVQQAVQSYPSLVGSAAGGVVGSLAGPVGTVAGIGAGAGAGSLALDVGSTLLEGLTQAAQNRGVDLNNKQAVLQMLQDSSVRDEVMQGATAHGLPVAALDALSSMLSFGLGGAGARALRAGATKTATGLGAAGVVSEMGAGALGERLGQQAQFGELHSAGDVIDEMLGELGPGIAHTGAGAVVDVAKRGLRNTPNAQPSPTDIIFGDLDEGDLPSGGSGAGPVPTLTGGVVPNNNPTLAVGPEGGAFVPTPENVAARDRALNQGIQVTEPTVEDIDIGVPKGFPPDVEVGHPTVEEITPGLPKDFDVVPATIEEITLQPKQAVDSAEQRIADGRLLGLQPGPPLTATPAGVVATQQQLDDQRVQHAATPQPVDLNVKDPENVRAWLADRGVTLTPTQHAILEDLAGTPPTQRRNYIASVIDDLAASTDKNSEALANGLLAIAQTLPKDRAAVAALSDAVHALAIPAEQVMPAVASALAQDVMTALEAGVTSESTTTQSASRRASELAAQSPTPVVAKRGLKSGERIPDTSLSGLAHQLVGEPAVRRSSEAGGGSTAGEAGPRGGLRARRNQAQAPAQQQPLRRGKGPVARSGPLGNRTVSDDTSGTPGSPRTVVGTAYGSQLEDVVNKEALQQQRADKRAKRTLKRQVDVVIMSADEYEATYPGRNYQKDLDAIVGSGDGNIVADSPPVTQGLSPSAVRTIQMSSFSDVMRYLGSVMATPLGRAVADHIAGLGIDIRIVLDPKLNKPGEYSAIRMADGTTQHVIRINPNTASLEAVLHEAVHAATIQALLDPKTPAQRVAATRMKALFEYAKRQRGDIEAYGFRNLQEFVAEMFSSNEFQREMSHTMLPEKKVSVWQAFKNFVMKLVGINEPNSRFESVLDRAFDISGPLFNKDQIQLAGTAGAPSANVKAPSTAIIGAKNGARSMIAYEKGGTYTLYDITPGNPRGDPATKTPGLSRAQVEQRITAKGHDVIAPAGTRPTPGVPKNSSTKLVGFDPNGDLRAAAFEQKDGTWTYYQSDADVRADPDAKVSKGLTRLQVERYIAQAGYLNTAPTPAAVKPNAASPTAVGYDPASNFRYNTQDTTAPLKAIGAAQNKLGARPSENVAVAANLRNSNAERAYSDAVRKYVEPVKQAGLQLIKQWGKTQEEILDTVQQLHIVERLTNKIQQTYRGSDDPVTQAKRVRELQAKLDAANVKLNAIRNTNPGYLRAVQQEFAPKLKALTDNITDLAAQYGRISRDVAERIKRAYDYYVPLQTGDRTTSGKAATGANVDTDRSFARIVEQLHRTINQGESNRVIEAVARLIETQGVVNNETGQPVATVGPGVKVRYDEDTNSLSEQVDNHTFDPNSITFYRNGERVVVSVTGDPVLLKALSPYKGQERNEVLAGIMAVSSWLNRLIAIGKTSMSPAFGMGNFLRDVQTANINLPPGVSRVKFNTQLVNPATYTEVATNVARELAGALPTGRYAQARRDGAFISHRDYVNLGAIANDLDTIFAPTRSLKGVNALRKHYQTKTFELLSMFSQISESVPRFAMYKAAYDSAIENGHAPKEARLYAANAAKTASVNFEQRGAYNLSSWWIFGNAKAQGLAALNDSIKRMGVTKAALGVSGLVGLGLAAAALQYQDSDKDKDGKSKATKVPNYKKDNLVFRKEGGYGVPISQEISPLYILGHALGEYAHGGVSGTETASRIFTSILNNLWPGNVPQQEVAGYKASVPGFALRSVLPSSLLPVVDLYSNENTFGSKVVNNKEDRLKRGIPLSEMGSANENELAVNAAKGLYKSTNGGIDVAPQQLKLVHNYFDPITEQYAFVRDMLGLREEKYQGDVVNPIARRFTANATGFYDQDQFDALLAQATRAKYMAEHNGINSLSPEDQALARSAGMLAKVQSDANSLFKGSNLMTKERRDLLNERKQEMILDGIKRYNELRDRTVPKR